MLMLNSLDNNILDRIYDDIKDSKLHISILNEEVENIGEFDLLVERACYPKKFSAFAHDNTKSYGAYIFKTCFSKSVEDIDRNIINTRLDVISHLFDRWESAGLNVHHAKNPFKSKSFIKYLRDIGFYESDYVILGIVGAK